MSVRAIRPVGLEYLALVTDLLQRQRLADPFAGLFEAADMQWWYTRDQHTSDRDAVVWLVDDVPATAALVSRWSPGRYNAAVLGDRSRAPAWDFVRTRCGELVDEMPDADIEMEVDPSDTEGAAHAALAGFTDVIESFDVMWVDAAGLGDPRPMPDGYQVRDRSAVPGAHPMVTRNGAEIENRLRECSLYDPRLDLAAVATEGQVAGDVAGYALFWADLRTGVGMVEPMRIEDAHGGRGVAAALLDEGLTRLAAHGCTRLKVLHEVSNPVAARLYRGAGFRPHGRVPLHRWVPATAARRE